MRSSIWLILLVTCLDAGSVVTTQDTAESAPKMAQYFVGLIFRGPTWSPEVTEQGRELQAAHRANIRRLVERGEIVLAGPFADGGDMRGLFFYNVATLEAAQAL